MGENAKEAYNGVVTEEGLGTTDYGWKEDGLDAEDRYIELIQDNRSQSDDM